MAELGTRRLRALDETDHLPSHLKQSVHEFGLPIVSVLLKHGVDDPRHIREVVIECWRGARQTGQRTHALNAVDFVLAQGPVSSVTLRRLLLDNNMVIAPIHPTRTMLDASMAEVSGFNVRCTREEKHRRRLIAALSTQATMRSKAA